MMVRSLKIFYVLELNVLELLYHHLPHSVFLWQKISKAKERRNAENSGHGDTVGNHHYDDPPLVVKKMVTLDKVNKLEQIHQQALRNSCELLRQRKELHTNNETSCKLMEMRASSWKCVQAHETACKLMVLHVSSWNFMY